MIYYISPLDEAKITEDLEKRIKSVVPESNNRFMLPKKNGCFVNFSGTSSELRDLMVLSGTDFIKSMPQEYKDRLPDATKKIMNENTVIEPVSALIISVVPGGFNGFAPAEAWEWLSSKLR